MIRCWSLQDVTDFRARPLAMKRNSPIHASLANLDVAVRSIEIHHIHRLSDIFMVLVRDLPQVVMPVMLEGRVEGTIRVLPSKQLKDARQVSRHFNEATVLFFTVLCRKRQQ